MNGGSSIRAMETTPALSPDEDGDECLGRQAQIEPVAGTTASSKENKEPLACKYLLVYGFRRCQTYKNRGCDTRSITTSWRTER
jgi:hypothetical protein